MLRNWPAVSVDRSYISKLEKAVAGPPDIEVIAQLSYVLAVQCLVSCGCSEHISFEELITPILLTQRIPLFPDIARECEQYPSIL